METETTAPAAAKRRARKLYKFDIEACVSLVKERVVGERGIIDGARGAAAILCPLIGGKPKEHFVVIALNARRESLGVVIVSVGTLSASLVHPREVFAPALLLNAAALIVAHNHPSGDPSPSAEDREVTRRLQRAGELMGVPVVDHVIVGSSVVESGLNDGPRQGRPSFYSFRDHGLL